MKKWRIQKTMEWDQESRNERIQLIDDWYDKFIEHLEKERKEIILEVIEKDYDD